VSKAGHVDADKATDHIAKVTEVENDLSYEISYGDASSGESDSGGRAIVLVILIAVTIIVWKRRSFRW
jgi:hypothetical protein